MNTVRDLLKNSLALHSELQEKGVENCLQTVTKDGFKIKNDEMKIIFKRPIEYTVYLFEPGIETA